MNYLMVIECVHDKCPHLIMHVTNRDFVYNELYDGERVCV